MIKLYKKKTVFRLVAAADVINDVSLSLNDSPLVCKAASSETVKPETLIVTAAAALTAIPVPA